jgi:ParB-like chromosome segregation protein Spo0J
MTTERARDLGIEQLPIGELKLDPRNPRYHSDLQVGQIARSIENFGFNVPVVIDSENKVLAGHGRVLAARKLGRSSQPVVRLTHLTPSQARAFSIADNRLTENSTWDIVCLVKYSVTWRRWIWISISKLQAFPSAA